MTLLAGTGITDISPVKPMFLCGYPHVERVSTGIHDPLLASALYLKNEDDALILIALDILYLGPKTARDLRRKIAEKLAISEENVFISCTHTHSGPLTHKSAAWGLDPTVPEVDPEYMDLLEKNIIEAAVAAAENPRNSQIAWTSAIAEGVGCNRHSPDGPRDPEIGVLAVKDANTKELFAISLTYSMHPTVMHEDSKLISGDFPHFSRLHLREKFGDGLTVLYHTGPAGNQSPRYHVNGQTFAEAERLGRLLGESVAASLSKIDDNEFQGEIELKGKISNVELKSRRMPEVEVAEKVLRERVELFERLKRENAPHGPTRTAECAVFGAEETVELAKLQAAGGMEKLIVEYSPADVQVLRIGDCYLAGLPGEVFIEFSLKLKDEAAGKVFVVSLVNGELQGYIVTPEAAESGCYEASNAVFSPDNGDPLINAAIELVENL